MIELGHGYTAERATHPDTGEVLGFAVTGNAAPDCKMPSGGRCGGWVNVDDASGWKLESEEPLHLEPSIRCACGGQHIFVRGGRAELCSDDVAGDRDDPSS